MSVFPARLVHQGQNPHKSLLTNSPGHSVCLETLEQIVSHYFFFFFFFLNCNQTWPDFLQSNPRVIRGHFWQLFWAELFLFSTLTGGGSQCLQGPRPLWYDRQSGVTEHTHMNSSWPRPSLFGPSEGYILFFCFFQVNCFQKYSTIFCWRAKIWKTQIPVL